MLKNSTRIDIKDCESIECHMLYSAASYYTSKMVDDGYQCELQGRWHLPEGSNLPSSCTMCCWLCRNASEHQCRPSYSNEKTNGIKVFMFKQKYKHLLKKEEI